MPDLTTLTPSQFENLTLDLVQSLGLKNSVWRTPGRDGGRDIQGEFHSSDLSGFLRCERWYVECKRYTDTVSWPNVWEKIAYAETHCADVLLFVTSSTLSPQAIDEVNRWNGSNRRPIIRFWSYQDLTNRLELFPQIRIKYGLSRNPLIDSAVSILPLTRLLAKYANTFGAYSAFGKDHHRIDEVIQALAELISARLEEIESFGEPKLVPFLSDRDAYDWIDDNCSIEEAQVDRYVARAVLSLIFCHSSANQLQVKREQHSLVVSGGSTPRFASFYSDLQTIGFWGSIEARQRDIDSQIEVINARI